MLRENLDELQQTINLMQSENHEEFFDISIRNKKYGRVDALNGPILLEKYDQSDDIVLIGLEHARADTSAGSLPLLRLLRRAHRCRTSHPDSV